MTVNEAARALGVHRRTVFNRLKRGNIRRVILTDGRVMVYRPDVVAVKELTTGPPVIHLDNGESSPPGPVQDAENLFTSDNHGPEKSAPPPATVQPGFILVEASRYEGLIFRLAQLEAENRRLLEHTPEPAEEAPAKDKAAKRRPWWKLWGGGLLCLPPYPSRRIMAATILAGLAVVALAWVKDALSYLDDVFFN